MNTITFALKYGWRSLRRSGQRTLLAIICVAFGVMSLVAMQTLADALIKTLLADPSVQLGGDLEIFRPGGYLDAEDLAMLDQMQSDGILDAYTPLAAGLWHAMKLDGSGRVHLVMNVTGVDPATYPLEGSLTLREPADAALADVLAMPGSAAVTRDLADQDGLAIGDWMTLSDESGSNPVRLQVTAILQSVPDRMGDRILYSLETAKMVTGREAPVTSASLRLPPGTDPAPLVEQLSAEGWNVSTPELIVDTNRDMRELFDMMLKGAGILGLLVGGIGVANTMQVLLARRTTEIAMLKTLGYRQIDLLLLFGLETGLLGLAGSLLGLGAAALISIPLIHAFEQIGSLMLEWSLPPAVILGGIVAGTATAVIFGVFAILRTSSVRPAVLLRNLPVSRTWRVVAQTGALGVVLALPFSLLASLIMGSVVSGLGVVALALAGFAVLGLIMWLALFVAVRVPLPGRAMLKLARSNLKRGRLRAIFALIALFVGVFAVGFATTIIVTAQQEFASRSGTVEGNNLLIFSGEDNQTAVSMALNSQGITDAHRYVQIPIQALGLGEDAAASNGPVRLVGVSHPDGLGLTLSGQPWGTLPDGAYLPRRYATDALEAAVAAGDAPQLTVHMESGEVLPPPPGRVLRPGSDRQWPFLGPARSLDQRGCAVKPQPGQSHGRLPGGPAGGNAALHRRGVESGPARCNGAQRRRRERVLHSDALQPADRCDCGGRAGAGRRSGADRQLGRAGDGRAPARDRDPQDGGLQPGAGPQHHPVGTGLAWHRGGAGRHRRGLPGREHPERPGTACQPDLRAPARLQRGPHRRADRAGQRRPGRLAAHPNPPAAGPTRRIIPQREEASGPSPTGCLLKFAFSR